MWESIPCIKHLATWDKLGLIKSAGDHQVHRFSAYYTCAVMLLAEGRRQDARTAFEECVRSSLIGTYDQAWAQAFLASIPLSPLSLQLFFSLVYVAATLPSTLV